MKAMRGIMCRHRQPPRQAMPLLRDDLFALLTAMGNNLRDVRDYALLLIGFAGGFRRSELVGLDKEDVELIAEGLVQLKTLQGRPMRARPPSRGPTRPWCPVQTLDDWLRQSNASSGTLFRRINRQGHMLERLSGEAVSLIIKARVAAAGLSPDWYSGHNLRAGSQLGSVLIKGFR